MKAPPQQKRKILDPKIATLVKRVDKSKVFGYQRPLYQTSVKLRLLEDAVNTGDAGDWQLFDAVKTIAACAW